MENGNGIIVDKNIVEMENNDIIHGMHLEEMAKMIKLFQVKTQKIVKFME